MNENDIQVDGIILPLHAQNALKPRENVNKQ